jgi:hypothetical protein
MRTALDFPASGLDEHETLVCDSIRKHGWFHTHVAADEEGPEFAYTTGFWLTAHAAEVLVFSLPSEPAHDVLWDLFRELRDGRHLPLAAPVQNVISNYPVYFFEVGRSFYAEYLGWSHWFYGGDGFPCVQMVWPDREGRFPWEPGFEPVLEGRQPDLTANGWLAALR